MGKQSWQGAVLAAEHVNAEGGILGRQMEVIGEDNDWESGMDMTFYMLAIDRLLNYHMVDFVLGIGDEILDVVAEQKKIMLPFFSLSQGLKVIHGGANIALRALSNELQGVLIGLDSFTLTYTAQVS